MHRVFVSYHHANDQWAKDCLVKWAKENEVFIDGSVDTGDIPDEWPDQKIREQIRDEYLRDTTVTILLVGEETMSRKHIDWEIYSSMYDGKINKKSGIIVIYLPSVQDKAAVHIGHGEKEKKLIHPSINNWFTINTREDCIKNYPLLPDRIIDNLLEPNSHISILKWKELTPIGLRELIDYSYNDRVNASYNLSRPMKRKNG